MERDRREVSREEVKAAAVRGVPGRAAPDADSVPGARAPVEHPVDGAADSAAAPGWVPAGSVSARSAVRNTCIKKAHRA